MNSSDRLVGSRSRESVEQFYQTRLVRITGGAFAIWLDPFGMLNPQVVVNLLPKLGVSVDLVRHAIDLVRWSGCVYLSVVARALANKKIGQMAVTTIIAKVTSSDT